MFFCKLLYINYLLCFCRVNTNNRAWVNTNNCALVNTNDRAWINTNSRAKDEDKEEKWQVYKRNWQSRSKC